MVLYCQSYTALAPNASRWLAETMNLYHGDCLEILPTFPPASVDAIITDLPYGTTACEWDSIIPLVPMWEQVKRVLKVNGAFITTACQPFQSALVMSNPKMFRHEWIWNKKLAGNAINSNNQPLKIHESVLVFSQEPVVYYPILRKGDMRTKMWDADWDGAFGKQTTEAYKSDLYKPSSILDFYLERKGRVHPTQKPVELYEYIIKTYTLPHETVLDITMGSGTTGVAAVQTGREFIGIEKERKYFVIAEKRIGSAHPPLFTEQPPRQPTPLALDSGDSPALPGFS